MCCVYVRDRERARVCVQCVCLDVKDSSDSCQKVKCDDEGGSVSSRNKLC